MKSPETPVTQRWMLLLENMSEIGGECDVCSNSFVKSIKTTFHNYIDSRRIIFALYCIFRPKFRYMYVQDLLLV